MRQSGRQEHAVAHHEQVLAAALADHATERETYALAEPQPLVFLTDQLAREVIAPSLGEGRQGVGRDALPGGHAHVDPGFRAFVSEILAPFPCGDGHVHWRIDLGRYADLTVAAKGNRTDVGAARQVIDRDHLAAGIVDLVSLER